MNTRESFVQFFGEENAACVEASALSHANPYNSGNKGSDPFRWAICICIGYGCMSNAEFSKYHGFTCEWTEVDRWIKEHADIASHNGDVDYLGALAGCYTRYVK